MSETNLRLVVTPLFMDRVSDVERYVGRDNRTAGHAFASALLDFLADAIEPFPLAFPAYTLPKYPDIPLRRAVFRRRYNVVYEITDTEIRCLTFFATSQDAGGVAL